MRWVIVYLYRYMFILLYQDLLESVCLSRAQLRGGGQRLVAARHKPFPLNSVFGKLEKFSCVRILLFHSNDSNVLCVLQQKIFPSKKAFIPVLLSVSLAHFHWNDKKSVLDTRITKPYQFGFAIAAAKYFLTKAITVRLHPHACIHAFDSFMQQNIQSAYY